MLNIPYNNFKTQVCRFFEQEKQCHFGKNCTYAHGREELRQLYEELPTNASLDIKNPRAFQLLETQVQAVQPHFVLEEENQKEVQRVKRQILNISDLFKTGREYEAMQVLKTLF